MAERATRVSLIGKSRGRAWPFTAIMTAFPVAFLVMQVGDVLTYVWSGSLFRESWDPVHAGFVLDQPTIGKWYIWFSVFSCLTLPYLVVVRHLCNRRTRVGYWVYLAGVIVSCLLLLSMLTVPFYWVFQYIDAMGFTPARIKGIIYGVAGYVVVVGFAIWASRPSSR